MRVSTRLSILVFATSWLAFAPTVNAQNQSEPSSPTTPGPSSPSASITDNKLDAAAAAMKSVSTVKEDYGRRIAHAPDDHEKSRLANEGGQALAKAVTDQGLSVAEYTEILQLAQNNTAVREKILQRIK